jgi:hypothetical protein
VSSRFDRIAGMLALTLALIAAVMWLLPLRLQTRYWYFGLIVLFFAWRGMRLLERGTDATRGVSSSHDRSRTATPSKQRESPHA